MNISYAILHELRVCVYFVSCCQFRVYVIVAEN